MASARARRDYHDDGHDYHRGTTTTTLAPSYAPLATSSLPDGCVGAGAAAVVPPSHPVVALGTPASNLGPSGYPASASVVAFSSSTVSGSTCRSTAVTLASVSLFGGAVSATSVQGTDGKGSVAGLEIDGTAVSVAVGQTVPVGSWGRLTLGATVGRLTAPLILRLLQAHESLLAGTTIAFAFAAAPRPIPKPKSRHHSSARTRHSQQTGVAKQPKGAGRARKHRHRKQRSHPLKVTPPLGFPSTHYVLPVDGGASYVDTYDADRSDVRGGWHHGDDLFAPLGTPVVAVAKGTLSLIGWESLGGWRLWLTDANGNSFYYAHLAGYSPWILHHPHVRAGEVLGFLGRTGDAFTTTPHLHFEIHPHQLVPLGEDGAVNPTGYLQAWKVLHLPARDIPLPVKLKPPPGLPTHETDVVWHQLLVARHLLHVTDAEESAPTVPRISPQNVTPWTAGESRVRGAAVAATRNPRRGTTHCGQASLLASCPPCSSPEASSSAAAAVARLTPARTARPPAS